MPTLNRPQGRFLALDKKFRAFVAGFGTGKTWVGLAAQMQFCWRHPGITTGYFGPTYPHIRDIAYPTVEEVAHDWGLTAKIRRSDKEIDLYCGREYRSTIICRSMDSPDSIIGFKIGHATLDELDTMPMPKAQLAWRKVIARMRYKIDGLKNGVDVTTTPEGFRFTHKQFVEQLGEKPDLAKYYGLVHASTYDNAKNLPPDYIPSLIASYPPELIKAYLNGQFVNLTSGQVYIEYDRNRNATDAVIQPGETIRIGQDFNVGKMASVVYVVRNGVWHAVDELAEILDTRALCTTLAERYAGHHVVIYPDASGNNRKSSNASESDIALLRQAGFTVNVNKTNPAVKDRVNAVNKALTDKRLLVNTDKCKRFAAALERQVYDANGEPDKKGGYDHHADAGGYPVAYEMPIRKPVHSIGRIGVAY